LDNDLSNWDEEAKEARARKLNENRAVVNAAQRATLATSQRSWQLRDYLQTGWWWWWKDSSAGFLTGNYQITIWVTCLG